MMWGPWAGGTGAIWMLFIALLFVGVIVAGLVLVVRSSQDSRMQHSDSRLSVALQILDERFARGEIDQTEYEERRRVLLDSG